MTTPRSTMSPLSAVILLLAAAVSPFTSHAGEPSFRLQLLHFADADGNDLEALRNVPRLSSLIRTYRSEYPLSTLLLSSGDNYIPGHRYAAASDSALRPLIGLPGPGRADIALLNALGVQASALGNHELDKGTAAFVRSIAPSSSGAKASAFPGALFPFLAANVDFTTDANTRPLFSDAGQPVATISGKLSASTTVHLNGHTVGIIGGVTPDFVNITDTGDLTIRPTDFDDRNPESLAALADVLQNAVDDLTNIGVNKIVMLTHMQQLALDESLAGNLRDVDIIVAGGSNTLLADSDDSLWTGDRAAGPYPLVVSSADDRPILIVNTAGDYRYLGRLVVDFDNRGYILEQSYANDALKGSQATDLANSQLANNSIPDTVAIADALLAIVEETSTGPTLGYSTVTLEGGRERVRTEETNLGNLVADANLELARLVEPNVAISLVAGGTIRTSIGIGPISQTDIQNVLRFDNDLVVLTLNARELVTVVEHGVAATQPGATPGRFPQVSGLRIRFDPSRPGVSLPPDQDCRRNAEYGTISRLVSLHVTASFDKALWDPVVAGGELLGDPDRTFELVTASYLANGGDGYPFPCLRTPNRIDLVDAAPDDGKADFSSPGREQDALAEYLLQHHVSVPFQVPETPPERDMRIRAGGQPTTLP